jgi:predicted enzyme related to lactoylglutathione lyase
MAEFTEYDEGTPCWVDLMTPDLERAKRFYGELFGWEFTDTGEEGGHYHLATKNGKQVAGIGPKQPDQPGPAVWVTYLWADDADAVSQRVNKAGGNVFMGPMDVPGAGRMALAADSTGAVFGVWQGREHRGSQLANEPGSFTWNENLNDNPTAARSFYEQVFDYEYDKFPDFPGEYHTFKVKGRQRGGIGAKPAQIPAGTPNFWNTYFSVADSDAAVAAVTRLGGKVMVPPTDTSVGRMAVVEDVAGTGFSIISVPKA